MAVGRTGAQGAGTGWGHLAFCLLLHSVSPGGSDILPAPGEREQAGWGLHWGCLGCAEVWAEGLWINKHTHTQPKDARYIREISAAAPAANVLAAAAEIACSIAATPHLAQF